MSCRPLSSKMATVLILFIQDGTQTSRHPFPSLLLAVGFLLLLTIIKRRRTSNLNLPPSPWKLPLIRSIHHVLFKLPHHAFHRLAQQHGPIMLVQLSLVDTLIVSPPEVAAEIMKIQDINFSSCPEINIPKNLIYGCRNISFSPQGDYWRQMRKIAIVELLSAKRIRSYHSLFKDEISNFMSDIRKSSSENKSVNLSGMLVTPMNGIIGRCAFGEKGDSVNQKRLILVVKEIMEMMSGFCVVDLFPSLRYLDVLVGTKSMVQRLHRHFDEIFQTIIKDHELKLAGCTSHRSEDVENLLDVLLRLRRQGEAKIPLTDDNLKAVITDMFLGGTDTSSVLVTVICLLFRLQDMFLEGTDTSSVLVIGHVRINEKSAGNAEGTRRSKAGSKGDSRYTRKEISQKFPICSV